MIDFGPSDEQRLIVETVRQFATSEVRPRARECSEARKLPEDVLARAHELGLVANALPGANAAAAASAAPSPARSIVEELAWGDLAIALAILSPSLVALPVADFGTPEQQRAWLPRYTATASCPAPSRWSSRASASTPSIPPRPRGADGDGWILDGEKCFVPWLAGDDGVLVIAAEQRVPQAFLVPRDAEGLEVTPERNMGLDALPTVELRLRGRAVPPRPGSAGRGAPTSRAW